MSTPNSSPLLTSMQPVVYLDDMHITWSVATTDVEAMQSRTSTSYIDAYDKTFLYWAQYGHVPSIVRIDAETSVALEQFLLNEKHVTSFQYFPTGTHRANRAERCIRT